MSYDRADWHSEGDYPADLPEENGGTHIGMFLAWAIHRGLEGETHREDAPDSLEAVKGRKMTGRDFLFNECDGKFWDVDLNDEGNAFATAYYDQRYFEDYETTLGAGLPTLYHVEDTWENFDRLSRVLDERFEEWRSRR